MDLLPCPFCGSEAYFLECTAESRGKQNKIHLAIAIACKGCKTQTHGLWDWVLEEDEEDLRKDIKERLAPTWNQRTGVEVN